MEECPIPVSKQGTQKILKQMNDSFFIFNGKEKIYKNGFFCLIKYKNKKIPTVIINDYLIDKEYKNIKLK